MQTKQTSLVMNTKNSLFAAVTMASVFALTPLASASPVYTEGWDAGSLDGWSVNTETTSLNALTTGGHPGGYLRSWGANRHDTYDIGARFYGSSVTGNYAARNINQAGVDLLFDSGSFDAAWLLFSDGGNGWIYPLTAVFPIGTWQTYDVVFDPTWTDTQARAAGWVTFHDLDPSATPSDSFLTVMESVYFVEVRVSGNGDLVAGLDNYRLLSVPEPASLGLLALGSLILLRRRRVAGSIQSMVRFSQEPPSPSRNH